MAYELMFVFFKQKTAYEMRISDWSSDVCSSDLIEVQQGRFHHVEAFEAFIEERAVKAAEVDRAHGRITAIGSRASVLRSYRVSRAARCIEGYARASIHPLRGHSA